MKRRITTIAAVSGGEQGYVRRLRMRGKISSWRFDSTVAFVDRLTSVGVPAYTRVDLRLGGTIARGLTVSVVGRNLLTPRHLEFGGYEGVVQSHVPRSWQANAVWSF